MPALRRIVKLGGVGSVHRPCIPSHRSTHSAPAVTYCNMPRIDNSQLGQPQEGNVQLIVFRPPDGSLALYLEMPILHFKSLCIRPRKYLRYLGWCIMGVDGRVARDSPQPVNDIGDEGELESGSVYSYRIPEGVDNLLEHAIHMGVIDPRSTPSRSTLSSQAAQDQQLFYRALEQRDMYCIMSGISSPCSASHIIPYVHENAWIEVIINSRSNNSEDVTNLTVNDIRNGMLVNPLIHACLELRQVAFLKTPNLVLSIDDIPANNDRHFEAGTGYPDGERFTLQAIEPMEDSRHLVVVQACKVGRDAAFSIGTNMAKPSGVLLHYNYGAAAVKWWGHHTDILRSTGPPHPPPPPPPLRRSLRLAARPTALPSCLPRPCPTKDPSRSSKKKGVQHSSAMNVADESVNKSRVWESWDEDEWMLYCMLNTKAGHERHQAAKEESASNIKAWAQEVSSHRSAEL